MPVAKKGNGMSIDIMSLVWKDHTGTLKPIEKSVLLRMADFAAKDGTSVYPSINTIVKDTGYSKSTVMRVIDALTEKNILIKTNRRAGKKNLTNLYAINVTLLSKLANNTENEELVGDASGVVSVRHQGSVCVTPGGSVCVTPDPSILDPSNNKINVELVFKYWCQAMNHPRAKLDEKRRSLIARALKDWTVDDLQKAITGCSLTPHNMGDNANDQRYDGLHIIFKDADNIERFIRNADKPPKPRKPAGNDFRKQKINPDMLRKIQNKHIRHNQAIQGEIE